LKRLAGRCLRPLAPALALLLRLSGRRAGVALVYHKLADRTGRPDRELVPAHGSDLFDAQLRSLGRTFRIVRAEDLPAAVAARRRWQRFPVAITFDDDLASHVGLALPALTRRGVHATFFLTGATLQGPSPAWWERLQIAVDEDPGLLRDLFERVGAAGSEGGSLHDLGPRIELLEPSARDEFAAALPEPVRTPVEPGLQSDGVRTLVAAGMRIGFHTRRHDRLTSLDESRLDAAFADGRAELETLAGERIVLVAFPHGTADERVASAARRAGFVQGFTGAASAIRPDEDPLLLGRLAPTHHSAQALVLQVLAALRRS
jgi:peptidoglycan/xylan/chitin deacetylase (PgdA/CDA1 family)